MARRVFFSFHYKFVWRVNQIRSMPNVIGTAAAGFQDASLWEEAKKKGPTVIQRMIDKGLENTSVTVVCVTFGSKDRKYIYYEIVKSLERNNGLVAIQIHQLNDPTNSDARVGAIPSQIEANGFRAYKYTNKDALARHIEEAWKIARG